MKHIECACCKYVRPDYNASGWNWTAYECGNSKSEYFRSLLNIYDDGIPLRQITWTGCNFGICLEGRIITAKEHLSQALKINRRIVKMSEEVHILRAQAENSRQAPTDTTRGSMPDIYHLEDLLIQIADIENAIAVCKDKQSLLSKEISDSISQVDNDTYRLLLELRYLDYFDWVEIAHILRYDLRYIYKLHNKALQEVDTQ